jgi:hypothetical protein
MESMFLNRDAFRGQRTHLHFGPEDMTADENIVQAVGTPVD